MRRANRVRKQLAARAITVVTMVLLGLTLLCAFDHRGLCQSSPVEPVIDQEAADLKTLGELDAAGAEHYRAGRFRKVLECTEEATRIRIRLFGTGDWRVRANRRFEVTLKKILKLPAAKQSDVVEALHKAGEADRLASEGNLSEAERHYLQALKLLHATIGKNDRHAAALLGHFAMFLRDRLQRYHDAEKLLRRALKVLVDVLGNHPQTATIADNLGETLLFRGRLREAEEEIRRGLDMRIATLGEDHPDTARSYYNLTTVLCDLGDYVEAEKSALNGLAACRRVEGEEAEATGFAYAALAVCLKGRGDSAGAAEHLERAVEILSTQLGASHPNVSSLRSNLAVCRVDQGNWAEAEAILWESLATQVRTVGSKHETVAHTLTELASVLQLRGQRTEAERLHREALEILVDAWGEDHAEALFSAYKLAVIVGQQGKLAEEESILRSLISKSSELHGERHRRTVRYRERLAWNFLHQNKIDAADRLAKRVLEDNITHLGDEHDVVAQSRYLVARIRHLQGRCVEAQRSYRESIKTLLALFGKQRASVSAYLGDLAICLEGKGKHELAARMWRGAVESFESARLLASFSGLTRTGFGSDIAPHPWLAASAARSGDTVDAWQALEAHLSRGLVDELATRRRPVAANERLKEQELRGKLANCERRILAVSETSRDDDSAPGETPETLEELRKERTVSMAELLAWRREIVRRHGPLAGEILPPGSIQAQLRPDEAVVAWVEPRVRRDERSGIMPRPWVLALRHRGPPLCVELRGSGDDGEWTQDDVDLPGMLREALSRPAADGERKWEELAARLYGQRLEPLQEFLGASGELPRTEHVVVLPSGGMLGVPVEVLASSQYVVSYAPSGTLYASLSSANRTRREGRQSFLGVGDPIFRELERGPPAEQAELALLELLRGREYVSLPGTRDEVLAIARLFDAMEEVEEEKKPPSVLVLLGHDATDSRLEELASSGHIGRFQYLHLATHAEVDDRHFLSSALVLGCEQETDDETRRPAGGKITASEILRTWRLNAELVTLSACETALGKRAGGDGYVGFSQALLAAGAKNVLLSLWEVPDQATALLMQRFYENVIRRRMGKARALDEAKRRLRRLTATEIEQAVKGLPGKRGSDTETTRGVRQVVEIDPPRGSHPYAHPFYWAGFVLLGGSDRVGSETERLSG